MSDDKIPEGGMKFSTAENGRVLTVELHTTEVIHLDNGFMVQVRFRKVEDVRSIIQFMQTWVDRQ